MSRTFKLVVEYDGTDLCGWQRQANGPTVQQHLEAAVAAMVGRPVPVVGASRTDAGVHALGQAASFVADTRIPAVGFKKGLNAHLPPAIAVVDASEEPAGFHARFSSRGKRYRYRLATRRVRPPLAARFAWHRPGALDVEAMRRAAAHLIGEHDFTSFRAAGCTARHAIRAIHRVDVIAAGPDIVEIVVAGNAFLRNMVRIVAGTLAEVGDGRRRPEQVAAAVAGRDRTLAGVTAPPEGLCLEEVFYPPPGEPRDLAPLGATDEAGEAGDSL